MKINVMRIGRIGTCVLFVILFVSAQIVAQEDRETEFPDSSEAATNASDNRSVSSAGLQATDPKYGKLDREGFPIDPGLGMNSNKITKEQQLELRRPPPKGYHIGQAIVPRYVTGKTDDVEWREIGDGSFNLPSDDLLARLLGLDRAKMPPNIRGAPRVLKSPSGGRVIVNLGGSTVLFEAKNGIFDVSAEKKVQCVNFDDKRRAFILWDSFASESLIVGHLNDDEDIEDLPSRQVLYTYDIDKMILRRMTFPKDVQENEWNGFVIDSVSPSAVLLRWDGKKEFMTVYLD